MKIIYSVCTVILFLSVSCKKDFLNEVPNQSLVVPSKASDFELLLNVSNLHQNSSYADLSCDDIYTPLINVSSTFSAADRDLFTWNKNIYQGDNKYESDWRLFYANIFLCNTVLEGLENKITEPMPAKAYNEIKGRALFLRALAYFNLLGIYAAPYHKLQAQNTIGIPIRLSADMNYISPRGNLEEGYQQVISDLINAENLLDVEAKANYTIPGKRAVWAMLARVYLSMSDYGQAYIYSNRCLLQNNDLLDFNSLTESANRPIPINNKEFVFFSQTAGFAFLRSVYCYIDKELIASYSNYDLRRTVFFKDAGSGNYYFKGSYLSSSVLFSGLANDELFLIRAECLARNNKKEEALLDLNHLLKFRYKTGFFQPYLAIDANEALSLILKERRRELLLRGLRWSDLRRLNMESGQEKILKRDYNNVNYQLLPNSKNYILPIPDVEINKSGIIQNERE